MASQLAPLAPIDLQLRAARESTTVARHELAAYLATAERRNPDAELAITEAVSNAVTHAFRGGTGGTIFLRFEILVPDTLAVTVGDDGIGMTPDPDHQGLGLGLCLIGRLAHDVAVTSHEPHGTEVKMHFPLAPAGDAG